MDFGRLLNIHIYTLGLPIDGGDPVDRSLGGSETAVVSMARALGRLGHAVSVFCRIEEARRVAGVDYLPHADLALPDPDWKCDVFLSCRHHGVLRHPIAARIIGMWNHDLPNADLADNSGWALSKSSFSFFLSSFHLQEYEKALPGISSYSRLITNGVDFEAIRQVKASVPKAASGHRFIYASRPERGLDFLLRKIWPAIRAEYPDAQLLVSSYDLGPLRVSDALSDFYRQCSELIAESPGVLALGSLDRRSFWSELASCKAVLYPTNFPEISCMVALEAQAMGVPIVTTGRFALAETVGFEETLISEPWGSSGYVQGFVAKVRRIVEDPDFRRQATEAGRRHISRASHSWDAVAKDWTQFFDRKLTECSPTNKISATILVKNEEAHIRRCVESFEDFVDEIIVGDTGSTDLTLAILESMGFSEHPATTPPGGGPPRRWVRIDFEDFAQARNDLSSFATGDYIYWQDADEVLVGGEGLRAWVDQNVYFDAFAIEQRHVMLDMAMPPDKPLRCFRPRTADGPLKWVGCVHELVEHGVNRPPRRAMNLADVFVVHTGYLYEDLRFEKAAERNWRLAAKDRRDNPERFMGYIFGIREFLNLAKWEVAEAGQMTHKAYRCLNLGFEIWQRTVSRYPRRYREIGFEYSRDILEMLARFGLALRSTGQVPIEVDFAFAARRGLLDLDSDDVPRNRTFYASVEELRTEFVDRLDRLETELGSETTSSLPANAPRETGRFAELDIPPQLFELEPFESRARNRVRESPEGSAKLPSV